MTHEDIRKHLTFDELSQWDLIRFCIERNHEREVTHRVLPLHSQAQQAETEKRLDLAKMLMAIANQILTSLEQEKSDVLAAELEGFLATLRDRERVRTIEHLQKEILRSISKDD